jgi:hypothetical protein
MSDQVNQEPRSGKTKRVSSDELPHPLKVNTTAKWAYFASLMGLIPGLGAILGWVALLGGSLAHRRALRDFGGIGSGHAIFSMIIGMGEILTNTIGLYLIFDS